MGGFSSYISYIRDSEILNRTVVGNTVAEYILVLGAFVLLLLVFRLFQKSVLKKLEMLASRTETDLDETFIEILRSFRPPFYSFLAFYLALRFIDLPPVVDKFLLVVLVFWVAYQAVVSSSILVDYAADKHKRREDDAGTQAAMELVAKILKGVLWVVAGLFVLSNLGVNITSLVAGLGIGGVAVALALQNVLSDLFSSFSIYFDKPFVPGDFIVVGSDMGVVEHVGIKTTRLRALQGEEIVISNQELTSARIHNFKKLRERRVVFAFGVTYSTPTDKLKRIPEIVQGIVERTEKTRFDRAHFHRFGDSSLDFEVVYYLSSAEYNEYMDTQEKVLTGVKEAFEREGIDMAFPTRTIYMQK